ncbi:hypothetical protein [Caballeronia sp. GAFFF1]|uniref:hypothetical protein n=1 Tax=Caballeronia sp. GAFFF1 TaxID=2921779 RepID=UPI002028EAFF|nr:hypothetical protein [Caballeronia sp. GAFFF1]
MALLNGEYFHSLHSLVFWIEASWEERRFTALRRDAIMPREIYRDVANLWNLVVKRSVATLCRASCALRKKRRSERLLAELGESGTRHCARTAQHMRALSACYVECIKILHGEGLFLSNGVAHGVSGNASRQNARLESQADLRP